MLRDIISGVFVVGGSLFILIASIGIIRFDNLLSRMHATTKATSFGLLLILIGVALHFLSWLVFIKVFLVLLFIYLTAPLAAHSIAKSSEDHTEKET